MTKKVPVDLHEKIQETVDGSRLIRIGIETQDPETVAAGWKRVSRVRGGLFAKKIFNTFSKKHNDEGLDNTGGSEKKA